MSSLQISEISTLFGEVLHRYRVAQNMSQEELAFLSGLDRTFVSRLERGIRQPTITTLIGIGLALGIPAADMIHETEQAYLKTVGAVKLAELTASIKEKSGKYSVKKSVKKKR